MEVKLVVILCVSSCLVSGYSVTDRQDVDSIVEGTTSATHEYRVDEFTSVTGAQEDQFFSDGQSTPQAVEETVVNDEENELFRDKRDVTTNAPLNDETTQGDPAGQEYGADDFSQFARPTTPDPNAVYEESEPFPSHLMEELTAILAAEGVNTTGSYVRGRANCRCGVPAYKIVGGVPASIRDYPWTVGLTRGGRPYCGGSLINSQYVLTASHCVDGQTANRITVVVGEQDYANPNDGNPQRYSVSQIIMHERYNGKTIDNDIALLRLSQRVPLGGNTNIPVCLPASNSNDFSGETATVAGWGATSGGGSTSSHLRKVDVPILSNAQCNSGQSKYSGKITANMMCAGLFTTGGKDSCQGDSGGPLTIENGGRRTQVGIVSWGYGCAQAYAPGVYTRVARYPEWILSKARGADWCQG